MRKKMTPAEYASKQQFPLSRAKNTKYTSLQLDQFRAAGVRAVGIVSGHLQDDCSAVGGLEGKKFTVDAVPKLPLAECKSKYCMCYYIALPGDPSPSSDNGLTVTIRKL
jgi:hypothetical protein